MLDWIKELQIAYKAIDARVNPSTASALIVVANAARRAHPGRKRSSFAVQLRLHDSRRQLRKKTGT
jgi:hypothetical protein